MLLIVKEDDFQSYYITRIIREYSDKREVIDEFIDEYCDQEPTNRLDFLASRSIDKDGVYIYDTKNKSFSGDLGKITEFYLSKDINDEYFIKNVFSVGETISPFNEIKTESYYNFTNTILDKTIEVFNNPTTGMYMALNKGEVFKKENLYIYKID